MKNAKFYVEVLRSIYRITGLVPAVLFYYRRFNVHGRRLSLLPICGISKHEACTHFFCFFYLEAFVTAETGQWWGKSSPELSQKTLPFVGGTAWSRIWSLAQINILRCVVHGQLVIRPWPRKPSSRSNNSPVLVGELSDVAGAIRGTSGEFCGAYSETPRTLCGGASQALIQSAPRKS